MSCAHRIPGYDGPCERVHGHTYTVELYLSGSELDEQGMLTDFSVLKKLIHGKFDHTFLNDHAEFQDQNPTTELMAKVIAEMIMKNVPNEVWLEKVRVHETPTSYVELDLTPNNFPMWGAAQWK
jgi:6-pyruvoyltetrahydropterin/6-carboxytetrahydropterin synthase